MKVSILDDHSTYFRSSKSFESILFSHRRKFVLGKLETPILKVLDLSCSSMA